MFGPFLLWHSVYTLYTYFPHDSTTLLGLGLLTSGRVITPSQRPLPYNTQLSQGTGFLVRSENQTRNPSKRPAAEPGLRPRGHRDRPVRYHYTRIHWSTSKIHSELRQPDWAWMAPRYYMSYMKLTYVSRTCLNIFKISKLEPSTACSDDAPTTDTSLATAKLTSVLDK